MGKKNLITIIAGLIVVIVLAIVFMRGDQLQHLIEAIEHGTPVFLLLALVAQTLKYVSQGLSFTWCFKAADSHMPILENIILVFQTFFVDTVIPSFNISGTSTVVNAATKRGIEPGRATGAALLRQVSISAAFVIFMVIGFAILFFMGKLETGWLVLGAGAIIVVGALVLAMVLAAMEPQWVLKIAGPLEHIVDKILAHFKRHAIDSTVDSFVGTYSTAAKDMAHNPGCIAVEMFFAVLANLFEICCFGLVGLAFGMDDLAAVVCIYVVACLAAMASPIPQGVGVVESASLIAFTIFGVEQATGMAIIMVYRVAAFWLPFIIGAFLMRKIDIENVMEDQSQSQSMTTVPPSSVGK